MVRKLWWENKIKLLLNDNYVNIVERLYNENPTSIAKTSYLTHDSTIVDHIIHHYEDHPF